MIETAASWSAFYLVAVNVQTNGRGNRPAHAAVLTLHLQVQAPLSRWHLDDRGRCWNCTVPWRRTPSPYWLVLSPPPSRPRSSAHAVEVRVWICLWCSERYLVIMVEATSGVAGGGRLGESKLEGGSRRSSARVGGE